MRNTGLEFRVQHSELRTPRDLIRQLQPRDKVSFVESSSERREHQVEHRRCVAKTNLCLGRMDIDVNMVRWQLKEQKSHRIAPGHQQSAVGFLDSMAETSIAEPSTVDE